MKKHRVLVVATSRKTRGGITSVIKAHETGEQWEHYGCKWIETNIDRNSLLKILYFLKGLFLYCCYLPWCHIVHIHLSEPVSLIRKLLFFLLARLARKKTIIHFHSFSPENTLEGRYSNIYRYVFAKSDYVVVLSQTWKSIVNEKFNLGDKIRVIYNPCTTRMLGGIYKRKKQILYAGTLNRRKGYADLIKAFSSIASLYPDWELVFIGNGEMEKAQEIARAEGVQQQTIFWGWVEGEKKDKIFKQASIFCLPSYAEGFSMAVLDAWAYGLPVVTTPVGGIPDIAQNEENMLLFVPGDIKTLALQLSRLIVDEQLRKHLMFASSHLAATKFDSVTINAQIGLLYKKMELE